MTQRRPPGPRQRDPENEVPTIAPDLEEEVPVEPLTLRDPTLEVERVAMRPKPKRPPKKGAGAMAWVVAIVLIGGIGAAVALVMTGALGGGAEGGGGGATTAATTAAEADAGGGGGSEGTGAAAADGAAAEEEAQAAAGSDAEAETQPAAVEDDAAAVAAADAEDEVAGEEVAGEEVAATDEDAVVDDAVAATDDTVDPEVALAAADGESAPADDAAVAAKDAAPVEDAPVVAAADGEAPATAAADVAPGADAAPAAEVVVAVKIDPAESKRLNDLGFAARKAGDHATAMSRYREAVQADPDNALARYNYACELALAGKSKEALAELVAVHKLGTAESKKLLALARKDSDFTSLRELGQFQRLVR